MEREQKRNEKKKQTLYGTKLNGMEWNWNGNGMEN